MVRHRMVMELGIGTDIRGQDYTKAACRALQNALRQNSLSVYDAFGVPAEQMLVTIRIGVQKPEAVDVDAVAALLPYGERTVEVEFGGMDTAGRDVDTPGPILANCVVLADLELDESRWPVKGAA
ncbi:MAG: Lin0512 family protein [Pseudomonadota bacterium]